MCACVCVCVQLQFHQNSESFMAHSLVSGLGDLRAQVSRQSALLSSAMAELQSQVPLLTLADINHTKFKPY